MHIGMLVPEFPSQTHAFFWREICALRALGQKVTILSTREPHEACRHPFARPAKAETRYLFPPRASLILRSLGRSALLESVRYIAALGDLRHLPKHVMLALCAADLKEFAQREGIDHLHVHSCADAAHVASLARRLGGPRYSLHLHGDLPVYGTHHPQKASGASFVAAAARSGQQQLVQEVGVPADRALVMRMGVDTSVFAEPVDQRTRDELHIVTVGRLNFTKGHRFGLRAVRRMVDQGCAVRYSIAGSGPHRAEIEAEVQRLKLESHVRLLGSLGETEVVDLLKHANVFLLPSVGLGEASPVAVMEAMTAGLCVVCSVIGGTADMIEDGVDGFLTPQEDVQAITDKLVQLSQDPELRARMGSAARARAQRDFDCHRLAEALLETITRLR